MSKVVANTHLTLIGHRSVRDELGQAPQLGLIGG